MFKVAIIGGERTGDYPKFKEKCINLLRNKAKEGGIMIYTIGDKYVEAFAERYGIDYVFFPCDFQTFGRDALKYRAENLLKDADALIAFSKQIKDVDMIVRLANEKGIPVRTPTLS